MKTLEMMILVATSTVQISACITEMNHRLKKGRGVGWGLEGRKGEDFNTKKKKTKFLELQILEKGRRLNEQ